jgi:GT2 family glycosyltransferase
MIFSVVIPTCNRNELLGLCLERLAPGRQTLPESDYEVIVTDDSKNDESAQLIANHYTWVRYVQGPKRGPAANRNNGAKYAQGDWLIFLDDDCEPDINLIESYYSFIKLYSTTFVFEGKIVSPRKFLHSMETAPINEHGGCLWSCNFCVHQTIFKQLKGFDETYIFPHLEDSDFAKRVLGVCKWIFVETAIVYHPPRRFPNGIKLGFYHQFDIYYYIKFSIPFSFYSILKGILITRLVNIKNRPFTKYSFESFINMGLELFVVVLNYHSWKKCFTGKSLLMK